MRRLILSMITSTLILLSGCSQEQAGLQYPSHIVQEAPQDTGPQGQDKVNPSEGTDSGAGGESTAVKALRNFYGNTDESIIIYEQIPFDDDCVLVLADRLTDGEHYPNLHLVSPSGSVSALTRHSYCWTLNFTQFRDYKIFFGLAGRETYQVEQDSIPVLQVEAVFADKTEAVKTRENIVAQINPGANGTHVTKSPQAYILPVRDRDMPDNVNAIFTNGETVSLSQISIDRSMDSMPAYFKVNNRSLYNSFAFTYCPMMTTEEWKMADSAGETGLKGKTDENGNLNAIFLRPSSAVFKTIHSYESPSDLKAFYLSNSDPWSATFSAGEKVKVVNSTESELYDCRVFKLTTASAGKDTGINAFQLLQTDKNHQITLPEVPGYYLFLLRTEKYSELRSFMGVIRIGRE